jgi:ABC-2 type transport system permease protein
MTGYGVYLVASQEFRVRLRTGRWQWLLGTWVLVVGLFTGLVYLALRPGEGAGGVPLFGSLMLFVLALALIVSPALTAQSINGDRERGTLATLQITRLTAADIAVGKLLAGWGVGIGALGLTVPFVGLSVLAGGVGVLRAFVVLIVVALLIGVVCAISMGLSALLPRSITSALLSYVVVFALTIGTLIAFGLAQSLVSDRSYGSRPDRVWWLLAANPFVVLADAAPSLPPKYDPRTGQREYNSDDPLGEIGASARSARRSRDYDSSDYYATDRAKRGDAVWPFGLGFNLLLGAGAMVVTIRRLRTPTRTLAKGVRVA